MIIKDRNWPNCPYIHEQQYMRLIASARQTSTFVTGLALRAKIVPVTLIAYTANVRGN